MNGDKAVWRVATFLAEGFEETEAIAVIDLLRRAGASVSLWGTGPGRASVPWVTSARAIRVGVDGDFSDFVLDHDLLFLPGGNPGTPNLGKEPGLAGLFTEQLARGKRVAAICAAPTLLSAWGLLKDRNATCFPGVEKEMTGVGKLLRDAVVTDGLITTSRGMGTSLDLGLALVGLMCGAEAMKKLAENIVYTPGLGHRDHG